MKKGLDSKQFEINLDNYGKNEHLVDIPSYF